MGIITKAAPTANPSGAIIGYNNLLTSSNVGAGGDDALSPNTFERFTASGTLSPRFRLTVNADVNYIAIAAHSFAGETVLISTSDTENGTQTDVESITFTNNDPILLTFPTRNIKEVFLSGTMSKEIEIGVIFAGVYLQMPRNLYGGHTPISLNEDITYQSPVSESGQFLSRSIIRKGSSSSFSWNNLDDAFIRDEFLAFKKSAQTKPFFIKWRPDFYTNEVAYGHTENVNVSNMGGGIRSMSANFELRAHSDL